MLRKSLFLKINTITLGSVLVLILVGSIVRSLGAGMGCPDWPKCFGSYIPPTSPSQLPDNYLEIFKAERLSKNARLSHIFSKLGYDRLAYKIVNDPFVLKGQSFDVTKAWIEYVNRLVGVLIGLLVLLNMVFSFSIKGDIWIPIAGISVFVLTGFQGWVGALVVSTNLLKGFITFHMLLAFFLVALLIWMNVRARKMEKIVDRPLFLVSLILFILFVPQMMMGAEVRAVVDELLVSAKERSGWASYLTQVFFVHRSYSWIILIGSILLLALVEKRKYEQLRLPATILLATVLLIAVAGIVMVGFGFPFWAQPIHLLLAAGIFSILFYLTLRLKFA